MSYSINLSSTELSFVKQKRRTEKSVKLWRRYECLYLLHEQYPKKEIASILNIHIDTVTDWIKLYTKEGFEGLGLLKYEGRRPSVLDKIKEEIRTLIQRNKISTLQQLQGLLLDNYKIRVEHSWLSRYCKKNCIALTKRLV